MLKDLREEKVSLEHAKAAYGVVVKQALGGFELDAAATETLRASLRQHTP